MSFGSVKFCVKHEKTETETFRTVQEAYEEQSMSGTMVFMWHKRFENDREDVEDDNCAGRPSTSRTDENLMKVCKLLNTDGSLRV